MPYAWREAGTTSPSRAHTPTLSFLTPPSGLEGYPLWAVMGTRAKALTYPVCLAQITSTTSLMLRVMLVDRYS